MSYQSYGQQGYGNQPSNPYGGYSSNASGNPYGGSGGGYGQPPQQPQAPSGGPSPVAAAPASRAVMSNQDFLTRVDAAKRDIDTLSNNVSSIASLHQRALSSTDGSRSAALESFIQQTQVLNTRIRDQIRSLETDAARSGGNTTKDSQIRTLKTNFKNRLEDYQREEVEYKKRFQEQIARQYRIVNPQADEEEVREAVNADWGDEGVFQTALKSNRTGTATSVLGAVRARHNDIQNIEKTLIELNQLFQDLAETVIIQEPAVTAVEERTDHVVKDTEQANTQLGKGIDHARRARKLKWVCCGISVVIVLALALGLGIYFGLVQPRNNKNKRSIEMA